MVLQEMVVREMALQRVEPVRLADCQQAPESSRAEVEPTLYQTVEIEQACPIQRVQLDWEMDASGSGKKAPF
jgi:hypothetical protein